MARRDIDVVVSARTDAASFKQAENRTRGFFARLRGAGIGGVEGGRTSLEKSQALLGKVAAVTATIVAAKEAVNVVASAGQMFAARAAEARGDIEAAAEAWSKSIETLRGGTITGPFVQMAEAVESLLGLETLSEIEKKHAAINAAQAAAEARQEAALKRRIALLEQASDINLSAFQEAERLRIKAGGDEGEIQTHAIRTKADADLRRIHVLQQEAEAMRDTTERTAALLQLEHARERVHANMAEAIKQSDAARAKADEERIAGVQSQIDAMRRAHDENVRTFGKEGAELEIEAIKLRTEAREREIEKLIKASEVEEQRLELAQLLADVQAQGEREIAAVGQDPAPRRERVGLASAQEGLLVSGIAAAAQANQAVERKAQKTAEDTERNTKETASVLAQLLSLWQSGGGPMPVLN